MISYEIDDKADALKGLFEGTVWDNFFLVGANFVSDLKLNIEPVKELKWGEVRPLVAETMNREADESSFQITLRPDWDLSENEIFAGVDKVFVHLRLQNQKLYLITGISYQTFVVGKTAEREWDRIIGVFLRKNHIAFEA